MNRIIGPIKSEKEYKELIREALSQSKGDKTFPILLTGLSDGARTAFYLAAAQDWKAKKGGKVLLIVPDEASAYLTSKAFEECQQTAAVYPYRDFNFNKISVSHSYEHERLSVLDKALFGGADIFITTPDAALQYTTPRKRLASLSIHLKPDTTISPEELSRKLTLLGYVRVDMVEAEGQYAIRGGICDIFPPKYENPVRVEFFGDDIDRIATFDIFSQRTVDSPESVYLTPSREIVLGDAEREAVLSAIETQMKKTKSESMKKELKEEYESVKEGTDLSFIDKYISVIYEECETFTDYFDGDTLVIVQELSAVYERLKSYEFTCKETAETLISSGAVAGKDAVWGGYREDLDAFLTSVATVYCNTFTSAFGRLAGMYNIRSKQNVSYKENVNLLLEDLEHFISLGYKINILTENDSISKKMCELLLEHNIASTINDEPKKSIPNFISGINLAGFELPTSGYVCLSMYASVFSSGRLISARKKRSKVKKSARETVSSYAELSVGDYVVHESHGVGRYVGLTTMTVGGVTGDYVKIEYAGDGSLYLPCTQLDMLSKYLGAGSEDGNVKLSKLGGVDWLKTKTKAKAAAKEMAKELIELYAERMRKKGIAFDEDDAFQQEFEGMFEYEETEGQLSAAREIKEDMERPVPMERLLCGDVGYGKTEVALRAAFKAIKSGYQVAVLVPTTILALQHYQTVVSRMRGFPITVDMISRFRKPKEINETVKRIKKGETDIVIGTHRLLSKDIEFKKLGLVIIDEEQRFGVAQKEKLKQLSRDVDVLTLTATPIPRTLNMAMSGIRDMSVLEEPPTDRIPVQTYVLEYDEGIVFEAIKKELRRGGQVFYLHNRVETLNDIAAKISEDIPEATVAVAHGQMDKEELSDIWRAMLEGNVDVLVCTTIIESGIDVPNANTLIIDDAERYGLAQLHQIRGRVGRSGRRAYAYLTYKKGMALKDVAEKRLAAIRDFTEFGSGFRVAMRDMEIRGAGNLLGTQQHGQIESVGYDLYMKLLNEAVLEEKGEKIEKKQECAVTLNTDAYIPEKYIRSTAQRIEAYKKIASLETEEDMLDVYDELTDRYGTLPQQAEVLLKIALLRSLGSRAGFNKAEYRNGSALFFTQSVDMKAWQGLLREYKGRLFFSAGNTPYITLKITKGGDKIGEMLEILKKYIQLKEENV